MGIISIDYEKCVMCGNCYLICPQDCFAEFGGGYYSKDPEECMTCWQCATVCKPDAVIMDHTRNGKCPAPPFQVLPFKRSKSARLCTGKDFPSPYLVPPDIDRKSVV